MALWEMDGLPIKKKEGLSRQDRDKYVKLEHESRDEDWNFLSLGACKFKDRKVHIRTFCPKVSLPHLAVDGMKLTCNSAQWPFIVSRLRVSRVIPWHCKQSLLPAADGTHVVRASLIG